MYPNHQPLKWRKSSYSTANSEMCVEVTPLSRGTIAMRDSKNPGGAILTFASHEWTIFVARIKSNEIQ